MLLLGIAILAYAAAFIGALFAVKDKEAEGYLAFAAAAFLLALFLYLALLYESKCYAILAAAVTSAMGFTLLAFSYVMHKEEKTCS